MEVGHLIGMEFKFVDVKEIKNLRGYYMSHPLED